jgi:uncharacterized membrane protein
MNKTYLLIITLILLPLIQASSINYQVVESKVLVKINDEFYKNQTFLIPKDASTIESSLSFMIENENYDKKITFSEQGSGTFQYITSSIVERAGNDYILILDNPITNLEQTIIMLPEGALIKDQGILPKPKSITTDGRTLTIELEKANQAIVIYEFNDNYSKTIILLVTMVLIVLIISIALLKKKRIVKKTKKQKRSLEKEIVKNLIGEEKQIVLFLVKKRGRQSWTKEIVKELNIPKVRLSRKLRSLEAKGLIQKMPYGNENRIKLLKK